MEIVTQIQRPAGASLGSGLLIPHLGGVVVNRHAIVGDNCTIYRGVNIGDSGRGDERGVPIIGNNVIIYSIASVVGMIQVGDGAVIAANSLVTRDVAPRALARGVPATISEQHRD